MVAVTSMNLIDVESIVANIMLGDSVRSSRLVEQKSEQNAEITAFQALNTSLLVIATKADAISESTSWVPATVAVVTPPRRRRTPRVERSLGRLLTRSPWIGCRCPRYSTAITYTKNGVLQRATSTSNTFQDLADFPGLVITVSSTGGPVTLTPAATASTTASVTTSSTAKALVTALNSSLALITTQTSETGDLDTNYLPRNISQQLLNTAWDSNTLASLSDAGIQLTRTGTFAFTEAT